MADYSQITAFTPKDSLTTGDPNKKIRGSQLDPEFDAISTAIASKYDSADLASNAQAAALASDAVLVTPAKLAYALQNATLTLGSGISLEGTETFPNVANPVTASDAELNILDGATVTTAELNKLDGVTASTAELNILDGVTASAAELNVLDGITVSTEDLNALGGIKFAYCTVTSAGALHSTVTNKGITSVTKNGTGDYTVNYTAAGFSSPPVIIASVVGTGSSSASISGGFGSATQATILTTNDLASGAAVDRQFSFLAIGT